MKRRELATLLEKVIENSSDQTYARQMIAAEIARDLFDQDARLAKVFAQSGVFSDLTGMTEQQAIATAMTKIRLGRSWDINEADAMQFIFFNNGRPGIMNELYAAKIRDAGYDWDVEWLGDDSDKPTGCRLWLKKWSSEVRDYQPVLTRDGKQVSESFTKQDADTALIWEKGKQVPLSMKWNYQSWARDMYFWRALTRLRRFHVTNILRGAMLQEEAQDIQPPSREDVLERRLREQGASEERIQEVVSAEKGKKERKANGVPKQETASPKPEIIPVYDDFPDAGTIADGGKCYVAGKLYTYRAERSGYEPTVEPEHEAKHA